MLSRVVGSTRILWAGAAVVVVLMLVVACGGPADQKGSSSGNNNGTISNQSSQNNTGSVSSQSTGSGSQSSSSSAITGYDACATYSWLGGAGGFSYQSGDGTRVNSSKAAQSDFAAAVGKFAEDSLEDVLDGDVSAACFIESETANAGSVYVALAVPGGHPSGIASAVGEAMKERGANVLGSYSATSPEGTYDVITVQGIPVETPNNLPATGGMYFITTQEGVFQAVMVISYAGDGGLTSSDSSNAPAAPSSAQVPPPDPTVVSVSPSGMAGNINDDLKPALEDALKADLLVQTFFQNSTGGNSTAAISYIIDGQLPDGFDLSAALSEVVEDMDGTVTSAFASADATSVFFGGVKIGDFSVDGGFTYVPEQRQLAATFTSIIDQ